MKKLFIIALVFFITSFAKAADWGEWKTINSSAIPLNLNNISNIIGQTSFSAWRMDGKFEGAKGFVIWVENYSNEGKLIIEYVKFPPAWVIVGSGNDKKLLINKTASLLNVDKKNNPLKRLSKNEIERYRDIENNVVPHVFFSYDNNSCLVFNKGYYKRESGYVKSSEDDETLTAVFCKYSGSLSESDAHQLIDSIQVK